MNRLPVTLFALCLAACGARSDDAPRMLRAADTHPSGYPTVAAVEHMSEILEEETDGRVRIRVYPGRQLGEERDTIEQTVFGAVDITRVNAAALTSIIPETRVLQLPFIFRSREHRDAVLSGPIGDEILASMEPFGLIGLAYYDSGARSIYTKDQPVRAPADLKGLRIRVPGSFVAISMIEALGGNATPMEFGQVYEAIRSGAVDGAENNWPSFFDTRHYEIAKYYNLTEHSFAPEILVMSKLRWNQYDKEDQMAIRSAAEQSEAHMAALWSAREEEAQAAARANGNIIVSDVDKEAFLAAVQPVYAQYASDPRLKDLIARIEAVGPRS